MAFGRYLRRRGNTWFFRFRWPKALAACQISGELILSLKTGDYRRALHRGRALRLGLDTLMPRFTPSNSKAEAEALVRTWVSVACEIATPHIECKAVVDAFADRKNLGRLFAYFCVIA